MTDLLAAVRPGPRLTPARLPLQRPGLRSAAPMEDEMSSIVIRTPESPPARLGRQWPLRRVYV